MSYFLTFVEMAPEMRFRPIHRMTLANHFPRDCIGVRLRSRQARKDSTMSFFKKLFGGGGGAPAAPKSVKSAEHKGFTIEARPYKEGGQFQLGGRHFERD